MLGAELDALCRVRGDQVQRQHAGGEVSCLLEIWGLGPAAGTHPGGLDLGNHSCSLQPMEKDQAWFKTPGNLNIEGLQKRRAVRLSVSLGRKDLPRVLEGLPLRSSSVKTC